MSSFLTITAITKRQKKKEETDIVQKWEVTGCNQLVPPTFPATDPGVVFTGGQRHKWPRPPVFLDDSFWILRTFGSHNLSVMTANYLTEKTGVIRYLATTPSCNLTNPQTMWVKKSWCQHIYSRKQIAIIKY